MTSDLPYFDEPADGNAPLIADAAAWQELISDLSSQDGPVAFDAERAHGHRYYPKSYLFQLRADGVGTALIDPVAFEVKGQRDLSELSDAVGDREWVLHAASQDLPCMLHDRIVPKRVFDTEVAARLLNLPRVGLGPLIEDFFGVRLRKAHSADDWSRRPLPPDWLTYAALDVEFLIPLRDALAQRLVDAGKDEWANQEFEHELAVALAPPPPATDRWRRLKGLRDVRTRRGLAVAKALWEERERISADGDRPPGRLLPDTGIVAIAASVGDRGPLPDLADLREVREFTYRGSRRFALNWLRAIKSVDRLSEAQWPPFRAPQNGVGHPRNWGRHHPEAAERWERVRPAVDALADELDVPPANLIQPAVLREVAFAPQDDIAAQLAGLGARPWQITAVSALLASVM